MVWKSVGAKYKADALFFGGRAPPYWRIGPGPSGPAQSRCILSRATNPRIRMARKIRQIPAKPIFIIRHLLSARIILVLYNIIPENVKLLY